MRRLTNMILALGAAYVISSCSDDVVSELDVEPAAQTISVCDQLSSVPPALPEAMFDESKRRYFNGEKVGLLADNAPRQINVEFKEGEFQPIDLVQYIKFDRVPINQDRFAWGIPIHTYTEGSDTRFDNPEDYLTHNTMIDAEEFPEDYRARVGIKTLQYGKGTFGIRFGAPYIDPETGERDNSGITNYEVLLNVIEPNEPSQFEDDTRNYFTTVVQPGEVQTIADLTGYATDLDGDEVKYALSYASDDDMYNGKLFIEDNKLKLRYVGDQDNTSVTKYDFPSQANITAKLTAYDDRDIAFNKTLDTKCIDIIVNNFD